MVPWSKCSGAFILACLIKDRILMPISWNLYHLAARRDVHYFFYLVSGHFQKGTLISHT